jgi:hypothetical protein
MCEDAFVEYMMNHPVDECRVEVQVEMGNQLHEVQRELSNQILCKNIENCLWLLSDKDCKDRGSPFLVKEELLGHVKEAVKIKNPSQTLIELLQRVREERHLE